MNKHVIRTSVTDSVKGVGTTQHIDVSLKQTSKYLPFPNVNTTLSQRSVYEEERQAGNNFRLILTIVPYCSNVLFNALTEIIKDEGSDKPEVINDLTNAKVPAWSEKNGYGCYGVTNPSRVQMICDTEYSSSKHGGYDYHPGYDFFDNHILRNKSFKMVTKPNGNGSLVFNTLADEARYRNGELINYVKRISINSIHTQKFTPKHLYLIDDIMTIDESINQNLYEENGWWGFVNNTSIDSKSLHSRKKVWESMDISQALNNYKPCEFIDMYPDRSLFSFSPKFNNFTHQEERNWDVVITYPYKNVYDHPICFGGSSYIKRSLNSEGEYVEESVSEGNRWMGLKVVSASLGSGKVGGNNLFFRTYTKHGLSRQDTFYLYYTDPYIETENYADNQKFGDNSLDGTEVYYESERYYKVTNIGDLSRNNDEYYFYTSNLGLVKEIYQSYLRFVSKLLSGGCDTDKIPLYKDYKNDDKKGIYDENNVLKTDFINKILRYSNFRIRRSVNGIKSTYYMRLLRKVPNLRGVSRQMTEEEKLHRSKFNGVFDEYIADNASDPSNPKYQRLVNNEQYQMAFASNIYNDNISQITFMDGINTEGLTDNLGRPISELFYTIVKNNAGNEVWYHDTYPIYSNSQLKREWEKDKDGFKRVYGVDYDGYGIEYSHCFGKVTSGLEMYFKKDDTEEIIGPIDYLKKLSSASHITNIVNLGDLSQNNPIEEDLVSNNLDDNISYKDTFFYGDLVEFNAADFQESVLSNVMHRFNTAQRETKNNKFYSQYQFHEITEDDYDPYDFEVTEYSAVNGNKDDDRTTNDFQTISRPEGYIYKANYSIPIREYTRILQDSHYTLRVRNAKPVQQEGILIQIKTMVNHNLNTNDTLFICDESTDTRYITKCVKIINKTTFLMSPDYSEVITNATDFEDVESVTNLNDSVYGTTVQNKTQYKTRWSWLELCEILNGKYDEEISRPKLILRRQNRNIPDYATYIGGNQYIWRDIVNIGDNRVQNLPDYIFANGYFYVTSRINFFLKRQDPYGNNGLYFDGENKYPFFPNDPAALLQKENNFIVKDTSVTC